MVHTDKDKQSARELRIKGYSYSEIAEIIKIPRGTIREWVYKINLNQEAKTRILRRKEEGRGKIKQWWREQREKHRLNDLEGIKLILDEYSISKSLAMVYGSLLFWAEGSKKLNRLTFTNSDPRMIAYFMYLLRKGFKIEESKLRVLLHLHEYHHELEMKRYWSKITGIPLGLFMKNYRKPHTGIRKHQDFKGTCVIYYYDAKVARLLTTLYEELFNQISPVA